MLRHFGGQGQMIFYFNKLTVCPGLNVPNSLNRLRKFRSECLSDVKVEPKNAVLARPLNGAAALKLCQYHTDSN
jgi:hypothetical protein